MERYKETQRSRLCRRRVPDLLLIQQHATVDRIIVPDSSIGGITDKHGHDEDPPHQRPDPSTDHSG